MGTQHRPHSVRPCGPALLAVGVAEGRPRGGCLPPLCEGRLRSGAVPPLTARLLGGLLGSATNVLWARVCGCGGPTLSLWPACPVGAACRGGGGGLSPGGVGLPLLRGAPGVRRCPSPGRPSYGAGAQGSATRVSRVRSVWAWGPSTGPTACAFAGRRSSLWGWRKGVLLGGACHRCEGHLVSGAALPRPPVLWSGQPGFRDPLSRVRPVRAWGPSTGPTARALAGRRCSPWGWRKGVPGGGAFHHCEGRLRPGAVPPLTALPLGRPVGVRHPRAVGAGVWVWEPNTVPLACMPCGGCMLRGWRGTVPGGGGLPPL